MKVAGWWELNPRFPMEMRSETGERITGAHWIRRDDVVELIQRFVTEDE
jgi:hypothetical protein